MKLANEMIDDVRRRTAMARRGRRGRQQRPGMGSAAGRLFRAAKRLTGQLRETLLNRLLDSDPTGDIAAAWITTELLWNLLACIKTGRLTCASRAALD